MCESVIDSSYARPPDRPALMWKCSPLLGDPGARGGAEGQARHAKDPGCDGYLWGRVTASGKWVLDGGGHWKSPPSPSCLFTEAATVAAGVPDFCLCTPSPPVPPHNSPPSHRATLSSREKKNLDQLLPPIQSPSAACLTRRHAPKHRVYGQREKSSLN